MNTKRTAWSLLGGLVAASLLAACGTTAPTTSQGSSSAAATTTTSSTKISLAPLAPKANKLCATPPTNPKLDLRLDTPGAPTVNSSAVALQAINESAQGSDGPFTLATVDNTTVAEPVAGTSSTGTPLTYGELYFSTNGAIPASVKNVEMCVEVYDAASGAGISAQFSGTNTAGPVNGAYDAAPEAYVSSGSKQWYTLSFNFSGIAFQAGGAGIGLENGSADFRISIAPPIQQGAVYFKRIWFVTQNVPTNPSLANAPTGVPLSGTAATTSSTTSSGKASGALTLQNCTPTQPTSTGQWGVLATDSTNPPTFKVPSGTPTVGNSLTTWPSTPMIQMGNCKTTEVWVYTMADSQYLYLAVKVESTYPPVAGTDAAPWSGDVVQFGIDGADDRANHPGNPSGYDKTDDVEGGMVLLGTQASLFSDIAPKGTAMPPQSIAGSKVSINRSNGVTLYEGALPWSAIYTSPGHTFGFNIAVSAGGAPYSAPYGFEWTHGIIGTKWPYAFAQLTTG